MSAVAVRIRPIEKGDLTTVLELEELLFATPWSRGSFEDELRPGTNAVALVADASGRVVGYLVGWVIADELHVGNIAVAPGHRRRGIARAMLGTLLRAAVEEGAVLATLEVRPSNRAAWGLYGSFGFRPVAVRTGYYTDNGEDAVVMMTELGPEVEP